MVKCDAQCKFERNGECILHPDKLKFKVKNYDDNFRIQIMECELQILEDRDSGMR